MVLRSAQGLVLLSIALIACFLSTCALAQEPQEKETPKLITGKKSSTDGLRKEIEPGVVVYGKPHRFAEVGNCQSFDSSPDGRTLVFAAGQLKFFDLMDNKVVEQVGEQGEYYQQVAYSPDGRNVFASAQSGRSQSIRVFDAITGSSVGNLSTAVEGDESNNQFYLQAMVVSADSKFIGLQSYNAVQVREVDSGELVLHLKDLGYVQSLTFSPDESNLICSAAGRIKVYDLKSGEEMKKADSKLVGQIGSFVSANLSRELLAVSNGYSITLFDSKKDQSIGSIAMPPQTYGQQMAFSDDGSLLVISGWEMQASGGRKMVLQIADVNQKKLIKKIKVATQGITKSAFSVGNQSLFVSGHGIFGVQEIRLDEDESLADTKYPSGPMQFAAIHPDDKSFITCTTGGELTWFDAATGEVQRSIQRQNTNSLMLTEDGSDIIVGTGWGIGKPISRLSYQSGKSEKDYSVKVAEKGGVFDQIRSLMVNGRPSRSVQSQIMPLSIQLSADGAEINALMMEMTFRATSGGLMTGSDYEQEFLFSFLKLDAESGNRLAYSKFKTERFGFGKNEWVQNAAVHPDGTQFAVARGNKITVVDPETGDTIHEVGDGKMQIQKFGYSPGGKFMYAAGHQGLQVTDSETGDVFLTVDSKQGMMSVAFSKDDSRMVCCYNGKNSEVVVYDTDSWKEVINRKKTEADRSSIAFSPDGRKLLIGLRDCRMEFWDLALMTK